MITFRFPGAVLLLAVSAAGFAPRCAAQSGEPVDGRIKDLTCTSAKLTRNHKDVPLTPRNVGMGLRRDDALQCQGHGFIAVFLPTRTEMVTPERSKPFIVPAPTDDPQYAEITRYLNDYGVAGATRGNAQPSRILSPGDGSAVLPENFVVRWAPVSQKIAVSILTEAKDVTVWGSTDVDGSAGVLKSPGASSALAAYKKKAPNARLVLTITFGNENDWEEARFSFLSAPQEQDLNAQLDFWAKHTDGLMLHLGRGYAYARHKLFSEAADEYETALESGPESPYLLKDAIDADQRAGRAGRVKELQTRLASLPPTANP